MSSYYICLTLFAVAMYFIVTDESIAAAFYYVVRLGNSYIQRQWWWLTHNPRNPIIKYMIYRRSMKMAKELEKTMRDKWNH